MTEYMSVNHMKVVQMENLKSFSTNLTVVLGFKFISPFHSISTDLSIDIVLFYLHSNWACDRLIRQTITCISKHLVSCPYFSEFINHFISQSFKDKYIFFSGRSLFLSADEYHCLSTAKIFLFSVYF